MNRQGAKVAKATTWAAPVRLAGAAASPGFSGWPRGAPGVLGNGCTSQTPEGQPFLNVPVPEGGLSPGGTVANVLLKFSNPNPGSHHLHPAVQAVVRDTTPPDLTAGLVHDTGVSASDHVTMDPSRRLFLHLAVTSCVFGEN